MIQMPLLSALRFGAEFFASRYSDYHLDTERSGKGLELKDVGPT